MHCVHRLHGLWRSLGVLIWLATAIAAAAPSQASSAISATVTTPTPWAARQRHVCEHVHVRERWRLRRWRHGRGVLDMHCVHGLCRLRLADKLRVPAQSTIASISVAIRRHKHVPSLTSTSAAIAATAARAARQWHVREQLLVCR